VPLTQEQVATLRAAADRIVPADDHPSASEIGVIDFLTGIMRSENLEQIYAGGLDSLEEESRLRLGTSFAELPSIDQDKLLSEVEAGRVEATWTVAPQEFFELLARQTIEGYYADPSNGGNLNEAAWKMVGFRVTS